MYCMKCGKEITENEVEQYNKLCKNCYENQSQPKSPKKKKSKLWLWIFLPVLLLIIILSIVFLGGNKTEKKIKADISTELYSVIKVDDEYFNEKKDSKYKDYELIFVSFTIKNHTGANYDRLYYNFVTPNNTYSSTDGYAITNSDNRSLVENFLKIIGQDGDYNSKLLGEQEKRCIVAFMIPKHEFKEDATFFVTAKDYDNPTVYPLRFTNSNIVNSNTLKELFTENEFPEMEQRIALYYTSIQIKNSTILQIQTWNNHKVDGFLLTLNLILASLDCKLPVNWNGQYSDETGYTLNFEKAKEINPEITTEIEKMLNAREGLDNASNVISQSRNLGKVDYSEYSTSAYAIRNASANIEHYMIYGSKIF